MSVVFVALAVATTQLPSWQSLDRSLFRAFFQSGFSPQFKCTAKPSRYKIDGAVFFPSFLQTMMSRWLSSSSFAFIFSYQNKTLGGKS